MGRAPSRLFGVACIDAIAAILSLVLLVSPSNGGQVERFYVSPLGRDTWSGRVPRPKTDGSDGPFATLVRARDAVREAKRRGLRGPVEVEIQSGTYYLKDPVVFTSEDSGTAWCPITYRGQRRSARATTVISGGQKIAGWRKEPDGLWVADVPEAKDGKWNPRILRVGEKWAIRARHPNLDPGNPTTGGWLFVDWHGNSWERGRFGVGVANFHTVGDYVEWQIRVPVAGTYHVWLRYGSVADSPVANDAGGVYVLQAGDTEPVPLVNLPATGNWAPTRWAHSADIALPQGNTILRMTNARGGGIILDAIALSNDHNWNPTEAVTDLREDDDLRNAVDGKCLLIIQAEACDKAQGKVIHVPDTPPPGSFEHLCFRPGDIPDWAGLTGAEVHVFPSSGLGNAIERIGGIDRSRQRILFSTRLSQAVQAGNRYFLENVREALDAPDEWFLDTKEGRFLYLPADPSFHGKDVCAPRLDRLLVLDGGSRYVEHLRFEDLVFTDTDYTLVTDVAPPPNAAIWMSRARNCAIGDCVFKRLGGYAVKMNNDTQHIAFTGNTVEDLGQGGVTMRGGNATHPHHNLIAWNTMRRLGLVYKDVAAVFVTSGDDNRIAHNSISDVPRYGVSLKSAGERYSSHRNIVEFNDIRRSCLETNDAGAIETLGRDRKNSGNVIRHNLVLDVVGMATTSTGKILTPYFAWGIYLDDYSSGTTVYGNIVCRTAAGALCVHGGKDNVFENNIFVDSNNEQIRLQPRDEFMKGNRFLRNIVAWSRSESALIHRWNNGSEWFSEWDYNLYWLSGNDLCRNAKLTPEGTWESWKAAGNDTHSLVADPLFIDPARDNYALRPDSPAFGLGFRAIPVRDIGATGK
jgi:hypothetical protein